MSRREGRDKVNWHQKDTNGRQVAPKNSVAINHLSGANPSDWYERCAVAYLENKPSEGYMDILARQAIAGDSGRMNELVLLMSGLAEFRSAKYLRFAATRGLDRDDLRQAAMCEMLAGLRMWNPAQLPFKLHAYNLARKGIVKLLALGGVVRIPHETFKAVNGNQQRGRSEPKAKTRSAVLRASRPVMSLSLPDDDEENESGYWLGCNDKDYDEIVTHLSIEQALRTAKITPEQRATLEVVYGDDATQLERVRALALELGVGEHSVRHTARRALRAMQTVSGAQAGEPAEAATKTCRDCDQEKLVTEFNKRSNSSTPQSACKKCQSARSVRNKQLKRAKQRRAT